MPNELKPFELESSFKSPEIFLSILFSFIGIIESGTLLVREN